VVVESDNWEREGGGGINKLLLFEHLTIGIYILQIANEKKRRGYGWGGQRGGGGVTLTTSATGRAVLGSLGLLDKTWTTNEWCMQVPCYCHALDGLCCWVLT
jgi:hypothetical protein